MSRIQLSVAVALALFVGTKRESAAATPNPFAAIDAHALKAPATAEGSIASLAKYLAEPCKTDKDKSRAIYRWITDRITYDIERLLSGEQLDTKAESVLKSCKSTCDPSPGL